MSGNELVDWSESTYVRSKWPGIGGFAEATSSDVAEENGPAPAFKVVEIPGQATLHAGSYTVRGGDLSHLVWRPQYFRRNEAAARLQAFFSTEIKNHSLTDTDRDEFNAIERDFLIFAAQLPKHLYGIVRSRFFDLIETLREEGDQRRAERDSLRYALRFLKLTCPIAPPSLALTEKGEFFLQWYERSTVSVLGAAFKADGTVIWSTSGKNSRNPLVRTAAAGNAALEESPTLLRAAAAWAFA